MLQLAGSSVASACSLGVLRLTLCAGVQLDRSWKCKRTGQPYYGEAIAPSNLSYYERLAGYGKVHAPTACATTLLPPAGWPALQLQ